jgi:hypothetical protein
LKEIVSWSPIVFYKNNWLISKFPKTDRIKKVIHYSEFEKNIENLMEKWIPYNFDVDFFENYKKLLLKIDLFNFISYWWNENSDYWDVILSSKNCYLSFTVVNDCENILYSFSVKDNSSNVLNSVSVYQNSDNVYFWRWIVESYKIYYSSFINNSNNIWFSSNLNWCSECLFCSDLENCSYYIKNKKYDKQDYLIEKAKILKEKHNFFTYYKEVDKTWKNYNSTNVIGSWFFNSENIENWYFGYNVKDWRNLMFVWWINWNENMYDILTAWAWTANNLYWIMWANWDNLYSCMNIVMSSNLYYCYFLENSSFCIGCIWLRNKSYCILNKQYTKEEWEILVDKIFTQMEKDKILWDFFPAKLNPFYFNDTIAGLFWNFKKEEIIDAWFLWRDWEIKVDIPAWAEIIETKDLNNYQWYDSNWNWQIDPKILKKVIKDSSWNIYKIIKIEYDFLMKHWLPIPEIHWLDRIKLWLIGK